MFFVSFTVVLNFIMVNMFLSIVNDSFGTARESGPQTNQYELMDFIWFKIKRTMGFGAQVEHIDGPQYAEGNNV